MKKKIILIFLFMFAMFLYFTTVRAESVSADDIESRTYIIGEHMYTRDTNGEYTGRLTTQYIMLGASTINSNDINQMIIYYKNPLGEWKNALNNQTITVPETFDIKYTNGEQVKKTQYGDVNCDGKIDTTDVVYIMRYLAGYEMPEEVEIINGDANGDGKITEADVVLLRKYIVGNYPDAKLPDKPLGKTYIIEYVIDNVSDLETYEIDYELEGQTLANSQKPSDPEKEGHIFKGWYIEEECTKEFEFDKTTVTTNIMLFAKFVKYGDVDQNGNVDIGDVAYIRRYIEGYEMPTTINITYGDVNEDAEVDDIDAIIIQKYLEGSIEKLPCGSGEKYKITYNLNEGTDSEDYNIKTYAAISLPYKLHTPTKEGYTFIGWTGSNGTTPQTEVTIGEGTTGDLEYTANWELNN